MYINNTLIKFSQLISGFIFCKQTNSYNKTSFDSRRAAAAALNDREGYPTKFRRVLGAEPHLAIMLAPHHVMLLTFQLDRTFQ